ncbi:MAG: hypothetical protein WCA84_00760, partial [Ignavibacteriaceae bacterium]
MLFRNPGLTPGATNISSLRDFWTHRLIIRDTGFNPCGILGRTDLIIRATGFNPCGILGRTDLTIRATGF